MFALLAVIAFAVAIVLKLVHGPYVELISLIGFLCISLHLLLGWSPWRHP